MIIHINTYCSQYCANSYSFYWSILNPINIVTSLDNRHKYRIHDVPLNRIKLSFKNIYVFIHVLRNDQR